MVTYLGSLVQSCCGKGGTLQTNITGVHGECSQCFGHTGFAPAHSVLSQSTLLRLLVALQGICLKGALGCLHLPGPSRTGSGTQVVLRGADLVGPAFCALPRSEQLKVMWCLASAIAATYRLPTAQLSRCTTGAPSQAHVDRTEIGRASCRERV